MTPLMVTIQCITYNHEPYIRQALEGFVMQKTNFRFEAIVHDDASTDGTADIIREYAERYPDIIKPIYETENQYSKGDGSLGRIMRAHTHGKYVALCEGDDYWTDPNKLQLQVDILENNPDVSLVYTGFTTVDKNSELISRPFYDKLINKSFSGDCLRELMLCGNFILTCTVCVRAKAWHTNLYKQSPCHFDYSLFLSAADLGRFVFISKSTANYRCNPNSLTQSNPLLLSNSLQAIQKYAGYSYLIGNIRQLPFLQDISIRIGLLKYARRTGCLNSYLKTGLRQWLLLPIAYVSGGINKLHRLLVKYISFK